MTSSRSAHLPRTLLVTLVAVLCTLATGSSAGAAVSPPAQAAALLEAVRKIHVKAEDASDRAALDRVRRDLKARRWCAASDKLASLAGSFDRRRRAAGGRSAAVRRFEALLLLAARARARTHGAVAQGGACGGSATIAVDPKLATRRQLPAARAGERPRDLIQIESAGGTRARFAANELIVRAPSLAALRSLLARWNGRRVAVMDLKGLGRDTKLHLLRIDPSRARTARLAGDVAALSKTRATVSFVSHAKGRNLLAVAAAEARGGVRLGLNWVGEDADIAAGSSIEGPSGPGGFSLDGPDWSSDAFGWSYFAGGRGQDIGVAPAWELLRRSRQDRNRVAVAVLDQGFAATVNGADWGVGTRAVSSVPGVPPIDLRGIGSDGWHGTSVANTAFAPADDRAGVAGSAGTVAQRIAITTSYDYVTAIGAIISAGRAGARVANMSFGANVPAGFAWTAAPFELATGIARAGGMLVVASAGNSSFDVDEEDCFGACWEDTLVTPCENAGVTCIGALGQGTRARAPYSNWGREGGGVDLFGPGTTIVGANLDVRATHVKQGTSFAAPFVAGVAALVWAARPTLSADDVERILVETAHRALDGRARRYVNALAAVRRAHPPALAIERPAAGDSLPNGAGVPLSAFTFEGGAGTPVVSWTTATGTSLGDGPSTTTAGLPYGRIQIRARAAFPDGTVLTDSVDVTVTNDAPTVSIRSPLDGSAPLQSETVTLDGSGSDVNQSGGRLRDDQLRWLLDGEQVATGRVANLRLAGVALGAHTLRLLGTDDVGAVAEASVRFTVRPRPPSGPPVVSIASPPDNSALRDVRFDGLGPFVDVPFEVDALDPDGGPLTFRWSEQVTPFVGPAGPVTVRPETTEDPLLRLRSPDGCPSIHRLSVRATDGSGASAEDTVTVRMDSPC